MMGAGLGPTEMQSFSPWKRREDPERILIIRLQALGDVALTLPATAGLRGLYPHARIDFLTYAESAPLARSVAGVDHVYDVSPGLDRGERLWQAIRCGGAAWRQRYDVVIDLQRNRLSRTIRCLAFPAAWGELDRYAGKRAAERVLEAFRLTGFGRLEPFRPVGLQPGLQEKATELLCAHGFDPERKLIVLNPAGLWPTRNWPLQNYVALAKRWQEHEPVQFLLLGTGRIREKAAYISQYAGRHAINLAGKTSLETAFALLGASGGIITEDSGLMHMAWSLGVPIVALLGSSRHVWSAPMGAGAVTFHSGDLPCGQCMSARCAQGDVRCLTRISPGQVLDAALELMSGARPGIAPS